MAIIQSIGFSEFCDAFYKAGRADQFSYQGQQALFEMLDNDDLTHELDVIALCCEYTENDATTIARDCMLDIEDMDTDDAWEAVKDHLQENTHVVWYCDLSETALYFAF